MTMLIINDLHLGVERQAGTTKESRLALENWMLEQFAKLLEHPHDELLILGDLFDKRNVEEHVMAAVIKLLLKERKVAIVLGNHDLGGGTDDHKLSSAEFVGRIIQADVIKTQTIYNGFYIIPHLHNQQDFDRAVSQCPDDAAMLVHCNIDSPWSHGDHSLNLDLYQIVELHQRGIKVIAAHEHAQRDYMENVMVIGNQFPSSIADCQSGPKRCLLVEGNAVVSVPTWDATDYACSENIPMINTHKFIELTGELSIADYTETVKAIAIVRRNSDAFIIKNSVKRVEIERGAMVDEAVTRFNIIEMLLSALPPEIKEEVKKCLSQE
jgi:DNA repair exonuclease SbcCD nuclease subunit